ncbi:MAG TPA: UrcA family protein [Caulobacteraceae bacterium]|jgi:UrcA family protein
MSTRILLGLTLSLAIAAAQAAAASEASRVQTSDSGVISVATPISDLNLSTPEGAKALLARLRHAASIACGDRPDRWEGLQAIQTYKVCLRKSMDDAVDQVHAPLVTALYRGHGDAMASAGGPG